MKKTKETDSGCEDQLQVILRQEREALKYKLDMLWNDSPSKARPILDEMQKLISITEEYSEVRDNLLTGGAIIKAIENDKDHLVKSLLSLLSSIQEWRNLGSDNLSTELRSFIEENGTNSLVRESILFKSDELLNILTDAANRIDAVINKKSESRGSHMSGDDSEYICFERNNENEITFSEVFKEES
jgi:hypothetical protein